MKWTLLWIAAAAMAQDVRPIGVIQSVDAATNKVVLKTDAGPSLDVLLGAETKIVKIKPGDRDLTNAEQLAFSDLASGDRILVRGTVSADMKSIPASQIIVMTKVEIASKQAAEQAAWSKGAFGTVKSVDPATGRIDIEVRSGMPGTPAKPMIVQASDKTIVRRYAPDSVRFADASPSKLTDIRPGDQLRARGEKSTEGDQLTADEIVSGSFRNIAATIVSIDADTKILTVTDLDTKKPLKVRISPDSSLRQMPEMMARFLAMRLNAGEGDAIPAAMMARPGGAGASPGTPPAGVAGRPGSLGGGQGMGGPGGPPNPSQLLERMPAAKLDDWKPGDALIIASTAGRSAGEVTAITILSGVEPILTAPSRNRQMFMGAWNLDTGMGMGMQ
jgi:Cu/Ag efflux protein CusF